jgi:DNA mismatch endonuclease (patch repair protein)
MNMPDKFDKATRSKIMASIKSEDTKMELAVKPVLESLGFEYQPKGVFGSPDFAHLGQMVAVFLDGCWWHSCPEHCKMPDDNSEFWRNKLTKNVAKDRAVTEMLEGSGWRVIRVWEHGLKAMVKENKAAVRAIVELGAHLGKVL